MTNPTPNESPMDRYVARMRALAEGDPQIRSLVPDPSVQTATLRPGQTNAEIIAAVLDGYAARPALGERRYEIVEGRRQLLPVFDTISYGELRERIEAVASAWRRHEQHRVAVDDFVCIIGFSGVDFAVIDLATAYAQAVTVPLQSTLGAEQIEGIFRDTLPTSVAVAIGDLALVTPLAIRAGSVRGLVVMDYDPRVDAERSIFDAARDEIARSGAAISVMALSTLIAFGRRRPCAPLPRHPKGLERMGALIHSSGSTGTPKGVIIPERTMNLAWLGTGAPQMPTVTTAFAPMNHFMGRHQVYVALAAGGSVYYTAKPDLSTLFEDIRLSRPTFLFFFPRVFELIYQHYQTEVVRSGTADPAASDARIRARMRAGFLGDRLCAGTIGSAPCAQEVKDFVRDCFDILLLEGYGSTESGIMTTMGDRVIRPQVIDYKLRDVPELGYFRTDKPYPRGELLVKSMHQSPGYFKRPEATSALFDEDGYVVTGDIMEERGPDHLVCIDRRNDVIKLSQAEFVAVGALGTVFESGSAVIEQIYLYGNSTRAYLLAVVVPEMEVVTKLLGPEPDEDRLKALIRAELQSVARTHGLRTFEVPRDVIVEREPFSLENGLLSSVRKRMRPQLKAKYGERLEALYERIERRRRDELAALRDPASPLGVLDKVVKALEACLGVEGIDPGADQTFAELGGDSLGSVSFSLYLEEIFGVEVSVNAIVSPAGNARRWAHLVEEALHASGSRVPTFARIHGKDARVLRSRDLEIGCFLDGPAMEAKAAPPADTTRTVLVTGANGFLGRFLCLGWLEQVATTGGKVIALVRASNDAAARRRLDAVLSGVDPALERHYREVAAGHLEVLAGDIGEAGLGLAPLVWERLATEVDRIVHPAALVNHVLGYEHLFGPNVAGTAELIRLALTRRLKPFDFVSSMAAAYRVDTRAGNDETSPLLDSLALGEGYADGYGASKWAGEWLLHDAHRRFGLPVNVFRGDMMMPHRRYRGQINVPDLFTRLLYSIVVTGLAPTSFYVPGPDGDRARAHFDGLPVDFVAGAIVGIGSRAHRDLRTYNMVNHHDDGISLDTVVDWTESAGVAVERVGDHGTWLRRFEGALKALPEARRQHSSLAILQQFGQPQRVGEPAIGCRAFTNAVRDLPVGPEVPQLSEAYLHQYLEDLRRIGLLDDTSGVTVAA